MATKQKNTKKGVVLNQLNVRPINRTNPDIAKWRYAIKVAESTNKSRVVLYDIYEECLLDGHLKSVMEKRINAVLNVEIKFFDKNQEEDESLEELIETSTFEYFIQEIMLARFWGMTLLEITLEDGKIKVESIDRRHIKPEEGIVVKNPYDTEGVSFLNHPFALFAGDKKNLGILLNACPYVMYKRSNISDWAEFNEIFGRPYPQGSYLNDATADILTDAFEKAGFESYMVAPEDAKITLHSGNGGTGQNNGFGLFNDTMKEELSIVVLGQNLTTKVSGDGSYAAGKVHGEVEESINNSDREFIIKTLNEKLIPILNNLGYNLEGHFEYCYTDELPLSERIIIDEKLSAIIPIDDEYFYQTYNIPAPLIATEPKAKKQANQPVDNTDNTDEELSLFRKLLSLVFPKKKRPLLAF